MGGRRQNFSRSPNTPCTVEIVKQEGDDTRFGRIHGKAKRAEIAILCDQDSVQVRGVASDLRVQRADQAGGGWQENIMIRHERPRHMPVE